MQSDIFLSSSKILVLKMHAWLEFEKIVLKLCKPYRNLSRMKWQVGKVSNVHDISHILTSEVGRADFIITSEVMKFGKYI